MQELSREHRKRLRECLSELRLVSSRDPAVDHAMRRNAGYQVRAKQVRLTELAACAAE